MKNKNVKIKVFFIILITLIIALAIGAIKHKDALKVNIANLVEKYRNAGTAQEDLTITAETAQNSITVNVTSHNKEFIEQTKTVYNYYIKETGQTTNYPSEPLYTGTNSYTFANLTSGNSYDIKVVAVNKVGNAIWAELNNKRLSGSLDEYKDNSMLQRDENTKIVLGDYEVTIPKGYKVAEDSGDTVEEGVVITDALSNGNEWVWVPVSNSDLEKMYEDSSASPVQLWGTTARTKYYTKPWKFTRVPPGDTTEMREPDLVLGTGTQYDYVDTNRIQAGFYTGSGTNKTAKTLDQMATEMVIDYESMIDSIRTNKGFYIGRYELGKTSSTDETAVVKRNKDVKLNTTWYEFYSDCKNLAKAGSNVTTRIMWGMQWNMVAEWLSENGFSMGGSSTWGNYSDYNTANGYEEGQEGYIAVAGGNIPQKTGYSDYWSACNIYDFAGNCWEFTQEADETTQRVYKGGDCINVGAGYYDYGNYPPGWYYADTVRLSCSFNN